MDEKARQVLINEFTKRNIYYINGKDVRSMSATELQDEYDRKQIEGWENGLQKPRYRCEEEVTEYRFQ